MLKQWYQNQSIKHKIIAFYLPLTLLPLLLFAFISNNNYVNTITSRALNTATHESYLIINKVESIMTNTEGCANMLAININNTIEKKQASSTSELVLYNSISNELSYALMIFSNIDSVAFIDTNEIIYFTSPNLTDNFNLINTSTIISSLEKTSGTNYWFPMEKRKYLVTNDSIPVLSLGKKIIDIQTGKTLGYLIINIKETTFLSIFDSQSTDFFIIDETDKIISSNNSDLVLTNYSNNPLYNSTTKDKTSSKVVNTSECKLLITVIPFSNNPWKLISKANLSDLTKDIKQTNLLILISTVFIILFEILSSHLLSNIISKPIVRIASGMKEVGKGNFNIKFPIKTKDEVGLVAESFNLMSDEIKKLLERINSEQKKKENMN